MTIRLLDYSTIRLNYTFDLPPFRSYNKRHARLVFTVPATHFTFPSRRMPAFASPTTSMTTSGRWNLAQRMPSALLFRSTPRLDCARAPCGCFCVSPKTTSPSQTLTPLPSNRHCAASIQTSYPSILFPSRTFKSQPNTGFPNPMRWRDGSRSPTKAPPCARSNWKCAPRSPRSTGNPSFPPNNNW